MLIYTYISDNISIVKESEEKPPKRQHFPLLTINIHFHRHFEDDVLQHPSFLNYTKHKTYHKKRKQVLYATKKSKKRKEKEKRKEKHRKEQNEFSQWEISDMNIFI